MSENARPGRGAVVGGRGHLGWFTGWVVVSRCGGWARPDETLLGEPSNSQLQRLSMSGREGVRQRVGLVVTGTAANGLLSAAASR